MKPLGTTYKSSVLLNRNSRNRLWLTPTQLSRLVMEQALMQLMTILILSWPVGTIRLYGRMKMRQTAIWMF